MNATIQFDANDNLHSVVLDVTYADEQGNDFDE